MSRWKDQLDNHQIHNVLTELRNCVTGELENVDENEMVERRRLEKFVATCEHVLKRADPEMMPFNQLDSMLNHLNQRVLPQAKAYRDQGNVENLVNANNEATTQLTQLALLHSLRVKGGAAKLTKEMEQQLDSFAKAITEKQQSAEEKLRELNEVISEQKENLSQLESQVSARKQEVASQLAQWQQQFSQAQEKRNEDYNSWRREIDDEARERIDEISKHFNGELENKQKAYEADIENYLAQAKVNHESIRELHQLAAEDSVAGGYVSNANKEGKAAIRWRRGSIVFISLASAWLGYIFISRNGDITWQVALLSLPLTFVLLSGAAYCAQQSARHRNVEVRNRRFALEMAAIDPYLQSLDQPDRKELKKQLTERFFGQRDEIDGASIYSERVMKRILETVGDKIIKPVADISKMMK